MSQNKDTDTLSFSWRTHCYSPAFQYTPAKAAVLILYLLFCFPAHAQAETQTNPATIKEALFKIQDNIKKLETQLYHAKKKEKAFFQQLATIEKEIGDYTEQLYRLETQKANHEQKLQHIQNELKQQEGFYKKQLQALTELMESTFHHYKKEKLQLLLEPNQWSALSRFNQYYQYFYIAREKEIKTLQTHLHTMQQLQGETLQEKNLIEQLSHHLKTNHALLVEKKNQRQTLLNTLTAEIGQDNQKLFQLQTEALSLEQILQSLGETLSNLSEQNHPLARFASMKHKLAFPIHEKNAVFTAPPHLHKKTKKTYIQAPIGTPVNAVYAGKVVFAEWLRGVGLLLILDHGDGYLSLYGNNQKLYKNLGDKVETGEMIAQVGQSGGHSDPGLYFEIRKNGKALDPIAWLVTPS